MDDLFTGKDISRKSKVVGVNRQNMESVFLCFSMQLFLFPPQK